MSGVLLDTDVLIDHIRGRYRAQLEGSMASVVTRAELYAGNEREEPAVKALLGRLTELEVTLDIARRAGRIRRTTGLELPDALIAATALEHKLPLMTRNRRHFEQVPSLVLHTPGAPTRPATPGPPADAPQPRDTPPRGDIDSA